MKNSLRSLILGATVVCAVTASAADEVQPFTLPMSLQPTQAEFDRFTTLNANNDLKEWQFNDEENFIYYAYSSTKDADDWVFIPVTLTAKDTYLKVSIEALASGASGYYDENFELAIGSAADAASMRTILTKTVDKDAFTAYETTFSNTITGTGWLGIHATSPKNSRTLQIRNIALQSYATPIPLQPVIKASSTDNLEYTATITMPSQTVQGNAIEGKVNLRFSVDGTVENTYTDLTPGNDVNVAATLTKGEHTMTFVAYLITDGETTESQPVSETVTAKDPNAQYTLPFSFGPTGQIEFDECVWFDTNGDDVRWQLKYLNGDPAFYYKYHSKNQANDWIILPAVNFGTTDKIKISVEAATEGTFKEAFEVYLGKEPTIAAMTIKVIDEPEFATSKAWRTYDATLDTEGGIWHVGIKAKSAADQYGLYVRNIQIESLNDPTGVDTIDADENAPAEYYSLQGMRLAAPEKDQLVIVRKGSKSYKAIMR